MALAGARVVYAYVAKQHVCVYWLHAVLCMSGGVAQGAVCSVCVGSAQCFACDRLQLLCHAASSWLVCWAGLVAQPKVDTRVDTHVPPVGTPYSQLCTTQRVTPCVSW